MVRYLKIALAVFASLFCLFYAIQNIANLGAAEWFVGTMTAMEDHQAYPKTFAFSVTSPILVKLMLWIIILLELTAGVLIAKGAMDMFARLSASSAEFNAAKDYALAGTGLAVIIWFGIFGAFGGAFFSDVAGGGRLERAQRCILLRAPTRRSVVNHPCRRLMRSSGELNADVASAQAR